MPSTAKILVQEVLNFIKSTLGETDRLGEKELSLELCMHLTLTTSSVASGIHHLDIRFMVRYMVNPFP